MLVLAAIPDFQLHRLRRAAEGRFEFVRARGWEEALDLIRTRPVELAVVDPLLSGEARRQSSGAAALLSGRATQPPMQPPAFAVAGL